MSTLLSFLINFKKLGRQIFQTKQSNYKQLPFFSHFCASLKYEAASILHTAGDRKLDYALLVIKFVKNHHEFKSNYPGLYTINYAIKNCLIKKIKDFVGECLVIQCKGKQKIRKNDYFLPNQAKKLWVMFHIHRLFPVILYVHLHRVVIYLF